MVEEEHQTISVLIVLEMVEDVYVDINISKPQHANDSIDLFTNQSIEPAFLKYH